MPELSKNSFLLVTQQAPCSRIFTSLLLRFIEFSKITFLLENEQLHHGIVNEKTAICMCMDPNSANSTLYLSSSHADAYIVNGDENKVPLPASVDVTSNGSQRSCIYLIFVSTRLYEISGYFIAGTKNTSFSFPIQVDSISPFNVTEKDEGKTYMKTYLNETVQFISRISKPIGSMLFQWDFGDGNVTQIEREDGTLTISHAYEKAGCFFATNSWLFLSDNQAVERFSITFQIEVLPSNSTSVTYSGNDSLQNSANSSSFREFSTKGSSIGYVGVMRMITSIPSKEWYTNEVMSLTHLNLWVHPRSLVVYKHSFDLIADLHVGAMYFFQANLPFSLIKTSTDSNFATVYVAGRSPSLVSVVASVAESIIPLFKTMRLTPMLQFSGFEVSYKSDGPFFEAGKRLYVTIASHGLSRATIRYNLTCSGEAIYRNFIRSAFKITEPIVIYSHGNCTCDMEAFVPLKLGVLQKYSAPGSKTLNRQHLLIFNRITSFDVIFTISAFNVSAVKFPKRSSVTINLETVGVGVNFEISYLSKTSTVASVWSRVSHKSFAKHEIPYSGVDSYNLHIKASNPLSTIEKKFSMSYHNGK